MSANQAIYTSASALWMRPVLTDSEGKITGVGATIELDYVRGQKFTPGKTGTGAVAEANSSEKIEARTGKVTVEYAKSTKRIDKDGNTVASSSGGGGGGSDGGDKVTSTVFQIRKADVQVVQEYIDSLWQICARVGENADPTQDFDVYQLGTVSETPEFGADPDTVSSWNFGVQGGKSYSMEGATPESTLAWAPPAITPIGPAGEMTAITPTPLLEADVTAGTFPGSGAPKGLLAGRAVVK